MTYSDRTSPYEDLPLRVITAKSHIGPTSPFPTTFKPKLEQTHMYCKKSLYAIRQ